MPRILIAHDVILIKDAIWAGGLQRNIAREFAVTQTTISRIMTGHEYNDTSWPDGSIGPLSIERRKKIHKGRRSRSTAVVTERLEEKEEEVQKDSVLERIAAETSAARKPASAEQPAEQKEQSKGLSTNEVYAMLEAQSDALDVVEQREMLAAIGAVGKSPTAGKEKKDEEAILITDEYTWKQILQLAAKNPFVEKAVSDKDESLKHAIQIVFKALPDTSWATAQCAKLLKSTMTVLEE